jgi:hypothetical protein
MIIGYVAGEADWADMATRMAAWLRSPPAASAPFANVFAPSPCCATRSPET